MKTTAQNYVYPGFPYLILAIGAYFLLRHLNTAKSVPSVSSPMPAPSHTHVLSWHDENHDQVDEASWESFPASDPPPWR